MNKFDICYNISKEILDKYVEFLYSPIYAVSSVLHDSMVSEIRRLVLEEYVLLHSMTLDEINFYLKQEYSEEDGYDLDVIPKLINKLVATRDVLLGKVITTSELGFESFLGNMEFSIYDTLLSMINIDVIKILKNKICALEATCDGDIKFINLLQQRLKISKIQLLFNSSTSEILTLYHNTGIDETPSIDIKMIENKLERFNSKEMKNTIKYVLSVLMDKNINEIVNTEIVNNNSQDVFRYLVIVTMIEVLISYMDKDMLKNYYDYCCDMITDMNKASVENVKRLIKNKIDN